jgi:magnesium transporter
MLELIRAGNLKGFLARAERAEPADVGEVLASLDEEQRLEVVQALPKRLSSKALVSMPDEAQAEETLVALGTEQAADILDELPDDDAADILGGLDPEDQARILSEVEDRADVERLLKYERDTAGGLMTTQVVTVPDVATAGVAIEEVRRQREEVPDFYEIFVADADRRLQGVLPLKDLVASPVDRPVREFMQPAAHVVRPEVDQEEVASLLSRYNLPAVPVVDAEMRLLGQVTFDDVIHVVQEEGTEDLLKFGGVPADEDLAAPWTRSVRSRLPWLYVNLATAFLAGAVVYLFRDTVSHTVAIAVWMPIIAGMGGNAGTQALAVTVRRLALGHIPLGRSGHVIGKEVLVGLATGLANGVVVAVVAYLMGQGPTLGLVVFLAMAGNLLVAGFAGALIPILLERFGIDPAIASSIFVTTFTDVCGFLLLLGLAARLLL